MNRNLILVGLFICIGFGIWSANHLTFNFNTDPLALSSKEQQQEYKDYQKAFKSHPDAITIGLEKKDLFNTYLDFIQLQRLTDSILALPNVSKIESIERIKIPRKEGVFVVETSFLPLDSKKRFSKKYNDLNLFSDVTQKFLSKDRTAISFYVFLNKKDELKTISSIKDILKKSSFDNFHILGAPAFEAEGEEVLERETALMTLIGCLLLLFSMFLFVPSLIRIGITLLFTTLNVCVSLIFMYLFNIEITTFTSVIPCVIAIFSFTDILHILYHYEKEKVNNTPEHSIKKNLFKVIGAPLILTSLSNLIGFVIFFFNGGISQITDLALVACFGIVFAFLSSRFILPTQLNFSDNSNFQNKYQRVESFISKSTNLIIRQYKTLALMFAFVFVLIAFGVYKLSKINMHYYEKDNNNIAINEACGFYDNQFQGIRDIEVVLQVEDENILSKKTVNTIDSIEHYLINNYGCKTTFSINTIIKRFNRFRKNGNPDRYEIPENLTASFFKRMKQKKDELGILSIVSDDLKTTRIVGSLPDIGTHKARKLNEDLNKFLTQFNKSNKKVFINGKAFLFDENVFNLTRFVLITLGIGVLLIGFFTGFLFKSAWVGLTTFLANAFPLLFGVLMFYFFKVDLNPASVFMLTIIMGIALDDSIYILGHYYNYKKQSVNKEHLLITSLKKNSAPLLITSVVLSVSFLALSISSYNAIFSFGIIMSVSLIFAFVSDLFFMPSLLFWGINKKTKC